MLTEKSKIVTKHCFIKENQVFSEKNKILNEKKKL